MRIDFLVMHSAKRTMWAVVDSKVTSFKLLSKQTEGVIGM